MKTIIKERPFIEKCQKLFLEIVEDVAKNGRTFEEVQEKLYRTYGEETGNKILILFSEFVEDIRK